ncbi:MAG: hypothetical protein RXP97_01020 [Nitrososphaeria archaeon]
MPARRAFESLIEELTGDRALRRLAIDGVLERLNADRERYSREEVEEGLEDLLHDVQYLGYAVHGVLSGAGADEGKKTRVAALYVEVAELYSSGGSPGGCARRPEVPSPSTRWRRPPSWTRGASWTSSTSGS